MDDQIGTDALGRLVAKCNHLPELPRGVDMEQREGEPGGMKRLHRHMEHHARILADRIEHDRLFELGDHIAHDLDRFSLEAAEMSG
ncbi:hypothetical protein V1280_003019 [Bradyrhizobium sp. AZCC 2230]